MGLGDVFDYLGGEVYVPGVGFEAAATSKKERAAAAARQVSNLEATVTALEHDRVRFWLSIQS